jgi:beta-fructofuranosidase
VESWIADDGERYHLFFLKAPRELGDGGLRHTAARIGHATSTDLVDWRIHDDALLPAAGHWDDLVHWTGSVARGDDGVWRPYDTGLSTRPGHSVRDQRIGMAESDDLVTWCPVGDLPLVDPDPRWYRTLDEDPAASDSWRDPFVSRDPDGSHMLLAAAPRLRDGVLGHARSRDMRAWEVGPPLTSRQASAGSRCRRCGCSTGSLCSCSPATRRSRARSTSSGSGRTRRGT